MPERELRQRIRAALKQAFPGALVLQWPSNMWTGPGWPDLLYSEWPLLVGFEIKYGRRSKPTPIQRSRHVELRNHHVPVYVVYGPDDAVGTIRTLKEKLPMAFDPDLLAELDAALSASPTIQEEATADQNAHDLANGTATLEDLPTFEDVASEPEPVTLPTVDDLQDARDAGLLDANRPEPRIDDFIPSVPDDQNASWLDKGPFAGMSGDDARMLAITDALNALQKSADGLTLAIHDLIVSMSPETSTSDVPQTVEAPAPRTRRSRRS